MKPRPVSLSRVIFVLGFLLRPVVAVIIVYRIADVYPNFISFNSTVVYCNIQDRLNDTVVLFPALSSANTVKLRCPGVLSSTGVIE